MYTRLQLDVLATRLTESRRFIEVLSGPRQVGKTTLARQAMAGFAGSGHYASADLPAPPTADWIQQQWDIARRLSAKGSESLRRAVARAEALAGRKADARAIASGVHSHDGGRTWDKH